MSIFLWLIYPCPLQEIEIKIHRENSSDIISAESLVNPSKRRMQTGTLVED
jgi:hypothetical protein